MPCDWNPAIRHLNRPRKCSPGASPPDGSQLTVQPGGQAATSATTLTGYRSNGTFALDGGAAGVGAEDLELHCFLFQFVQHLLHGAVSHVPFKIEEEQVTLFWFP